MAASVYLNGRTLYYYIKDWGIRVRLPLKDLKKQVSLQVFTRLEVLNMAENGEIKSRQKDEGISLSDELGSVLREMREKAGYSVSSLAASTRITQEFIIALEAGDLTKTPGDIFCRGFIKIIAKTCRQDPQNALAVYLELVKPRQEVDEKLGVQKMQHLHSGLNRVRGMDLGETKDKALRFLSYLLPKSIFSKISLRGWTFILGTTAVLVLGVYGLFRLSLSNIDETFSAKVTNEAVQAEDIDELDELNPSVQVPEPKEEVIVSEVETDAPEIAANTAAKVETNDKPSFDETIGSGSEVLDLRIKKELKIRIKVDKESWVTKILPADTAIQYKFTDKVQLLVFDASALDVSFNGRGLGALGDEGRIRRLSFVGKDYASTISDSEKEKM